MSDLLSLTDAAAIRFNARAAYDLNWYGRIPHAAIQAYPGLGYDPVLGAPDEQQMFADAIFEFQYDAGYDAWEQDKMLGLQTWQDLLKRFAPVATVMDYIIHAKQRVSFPADRYELLTWDNEGGLDLHRDGGWQKKKGRKIDYIVIHWGGINATSCRNALANRDLSSHFGVDRGTVYQWLDTAYVAWHGGRLVNSNSIAIDICQHPATSMLKHYKKGYQGVGVAPNRTKRGNRKILTLDERTALSARELVLNLCAEFDVPMRAPRNADGSVNHGVIAAEMKKGAFRGVVAHHHFSAQKWDIACWWDQIFAGTVLG